jgi:hypothetical protein
VAPHRASLATHVALACAVGSCARGASPSSPEVILGHTVRVDAERKLLSWSEAEAPYAHVAGLAWGALETKFPVQDNGVETWLAWSRFDPTTFDGINWPHNPAGLYAMLADSAVLWYAFSGDRGAVNLVRKALDWQLAHGSTPAEWEWARVPYASATAGDVDYRGADDEWCGYCGRGDGVGVIEPDKVGELGFAYLQFFELTADERYRDAAMACAGALAEHVRDGDDRRSPWPFRVYAKTDVAREEYSSNVVGAMMLFDELTRLRLGDVEAYASARRRALDWLMRVPIANDAWSGYFEDVAIQRDPESNPNQYSALRTARWLLTHRDADPRWRDHVAHLLAWAARVFGADTPTERGSQWGATVMSEQAVDMAKMGSHTARFGATTALWAALTGDGAARDRAARSLNWATYTCDASGVVAVGESKEEGWWFSDGYGDYVRHFLAAMAAVPEWAPKWENHVLASTSIVTRIDYAPSRVAWTTFDADATETLRTASSPSSVTVNGLNLHERADLDGEGYVVRTTSSGGPVVGVRHVGPGEVAVTTAARAGDAPATARGASCGAAALPFLWSVAGPARLTRGSGRAKRASP